MRRLDVWHVWHKGEMHCGFWWRDLRERNHLEHRGVDGRIILKWIFKKKDGGTDWIDLAEERGRWQVVVNVVMNLRVL
jgi:hypothetical protein